MISSTATKRKVTENAVTLSLAAWLTFDQHSCNFDNVGGRDEDVLMGVPPCLLQDIPGFTSRV